MDNFLFDASNFLLYYFNGFTFLEKRLQERKNFGRTFILPEIYFYYFNFCNEEQRERVKFTLPF